MPMTDETSEMIFDNIDRRTALKGALGTAGAAAVYSSFGTGSVAAQDAVPATLEAELEGPLQSVNAEASTIQVMGITVDASNATLSTATTTLSSLSQVGGSSPILPGRDRNGFLGGTAIVVGTTTTGDEDYTVVADDIFFDVAENVIVGELTANNVPEGTSLADGGSLEVQGTPVQAVDDPADPNRQPLDAGVTGLPVDMSTVPTGSLAAVEGYYGNDGVHHAHTVEVEGGTILGPAISITRVRCTDGGRLEIRGGSTAPGTITVYDAAEGGTALDPVAAVQSPDNPDIATYVFRQDIEACPTTVRVEQEIDGQTVTADAVVSTGLPLDPDANPQDPPTEPPVRTLAVVGNGSRVSYSFTVSGEVLGGTGLSSEDSFQANTATGAVRAGTDRYQFTGNLNGVRLRGNNATVTVDGEPVTAADVLGNTLTIQGTGTRADYSFTVSGALEAASTITAEDSITGSSATGAVRAGRDSYYYAGDITAFELTGNATVFVNGTETDPTTL